MPREYSPSVILTKSLTSHDDAPRRSGSRTQDDRMEKLQYRTRIVQQIHAQGPGKQERARDATRRMGDGRDGELEYTTLVL